MFQKHYFVLLLSALFIACYHFQVKKTWLKTIEERVVMHAYVMMHSGINEKLLDFNIRYLQQQGIKVMISIEYNHHEHFKFINHKSRP